MGYVIISKCGNVVLKYAPSMEHWYSDLLGCRAVTLGAEIMSYHLNSIKILSNELCQRFESPTWDSKYPRIWGRKF